MWHPRPMKCLGGLLLVWTLVGCDSTPRTGLGDAGAQDGATDGARATDGSGGSDGLLVGDGGSAAGDGAQGRDGATPLADGRTRDGRARDAGTRDGRTRDGGTRDARSADGAPPTGRCTPTPPAAPGNSGVTLHVAVSGNDATGTGAADKPFATLTAAAKLVKAGGTILVHGGTYKGKKHTVTATGSASAPIVVMAAPGEKPLLDGSGLGLIESDGVLRVDYSSHVIVDGFEVANSTGRGISVYESDHVTVRRCTVHDVSYRALGGGGSDLVFDGNEVYNGALANQGGGGSGGWPAMVSTYQRANGTLSKNIQFVNNHFHDAWGECLDFIMLDGGVARNNRIHDCYSVNLYSDRSQHLVLEGNYLYTTTAKYDRKDNGQRAVGINLAVESGDHQATLATDVLIANNVIVGTGKGIGFWWDGANGAAQNTYQNVRILYNVIKDTLGPALNFSKVGSGATAPSGCRAQNNIFFAGKDGTTFSLGNPAAWSLSHNLYPGGVPAGFVEPTSLAGDPRFVSPVLGGPAEGFKLQAGSPAVGKGLAQAEMPRDLWCAPRPASATALGVHQP
ncbi:MAG: right-handed parallel beta-helix repeat-containing protein [Deltaproteobacteria bacterium]|nr:right-handed parallel beta-helix repeat-containing protein [Deltaproteobacteria bacterium]